MFKRIIFICAGIFLFFVLAWSGGAASTIKLIVDGAPAVVEPGPIIQAGRVFVPVRFVAEKLGAQVEWDEKNNTVQINNNLGDNYLKGQDSTTGVKSGIASRMIKASDLKDLLDDDHDHDLADYRAGHNGGDQIANDPLVVDLRMKGDYDESHVPGAIWIAPAEKIAEKQNVQKLKDLLAKHTAQGGKKEIILYCYTGNASGLACGVLGAQGLNVKNLMYGFDIAWKGTKFADSAIRASMEDVHGETKSCGG